MKIYFLSILSTLLFFTSCDKDEQENTCGENSLENILWLKELVDNENNTDDTSGLEILQYTYKNDTVFSVNDCINNCSDAMTIVYDCDKNVICELGGIAGVNTCPDFDTEAIFEAVVFSTELKDALYDKAVIINEDLYNSAEASPIEKINIKGNCMYINHWVCAEENYIDSIYLIDSGLVMESLPVQRNLKFSNSTDYSDVFCSTVEVITSFDISALADWDAPEVILNIEGFAEQINYERNPICGDPNVNCIPVQEIDAKKLAYMLNEIKAIAESIECESADDWKITPIGSKACGGPQGFLAYSNKIDEVDFLEKVEAYSVAEENYNKTWGVVSTCDVEVMPTSVVCENGKPKFVYN